MIATLIAGGALALSRSAAEEGSFRLAACRHTMQSAQAFGDATFCDRLALGVHKLIASLLDRVADLRGEPDRIEAFPGVPFDEIAGLIIKSPTCAFPPPLNRVQKPPPGPNGE
jgi:hypothetical protein